jgi:glycerol-1-phosphatase
MDAARAFEAYLSVRHRLPDTTFPANWQTADTLGDIAAPFDLILLDAYGVLNVGETPVPGAAERIAALRAAGKAVMVISNSAAYPKQRMMQRYIRLGFDFTPDEVVTSRETLLAHLAGASPCHWGMMLNGQFGTEELKDLDACILGDDRAAYDAAEGLLLIGSDGWTEVRQMLLEASLRARPRPVLVGNPDLVAPREAGLTREPGHFAHRLIDATGIMPHFFGKPFPEIYALATSRHGIDPSRVLMVGDTLHTDVLGGRFMGFGTALVTGHGALAGLDAAEAIRRSSIVPDFVIDRI